MKQSKLPNPSSSSLNVVINARLSFDMEDIQNKNYCHTFYTMHKICMCIATYNSTSFYTVFNFDMCEATTAQFIIICSSAINLWSNQNCLTLVLAHQMLLLMQDYLLIWRIRIIPLYYAQDMYVCIATCNSIYSCTYIRKWTIPKLYNLCW